MNERCNHEEILEKLEEIKNLIVPEWISVKDRLPEGQKPVIATYINNYKKTRTIIGFHVPAKTIVASDFLDEDAEGMDEYDEKLDEYFVKEGWFEQIDNWGDFASVAVCNGTITHWQTLSKPPKDWSSK